MTHTPNCYTGTDLTSLADIQSVGHRVMYVYVLQVTFAFTCVINGGHGLSLQ